MAQKQVKLNSSPPVNQCIYCGSTFQLTDEHVVPYGLSGQLVLPKSSCRSCAAITCRLEQKLLRGHWWPYRQFLGLKSRTSKTPIPDLTVTVQHADGSSVQAQLPMLHQITAVAFEMAPPTILRGVVSDEVPYATKVYGRNLGPPPSEVRVSGRRYRLRPDDKLTIPVNFDAGELCRFLAKVAHSYSILQRGLSACSEYFLPKIILGDAVGAMTYVGGSSSAVLPKWLPDSRTHGLMDRVQGEFLSVYIQLFRHGGDPPPIYEVIVGRLIQ